MRLYKEIFKNEKGEFFAQCVITPCGNGYFEGVKGVEEFSSIRILIRFPRHRVEVLGEGLVIQKYCDGDLQVEGKILCARALDEGE